MDKYNPSRLNGLQPGKYAEYFVKMEFTLYGFQVYTAEVDDRGIDFVARHDNGLFFEVQVKSIFKTSYIFFTKDKFILPESLLAAIVVFVQEQSPILYLVPSTVWKEPNPVFSCRDYEGKKSKPEWGFSLTQKYNALIQPYEFDKSIASEYNTVD